jgi:RNA polymerase sigma factor (sigma-70 family)
MKKEEELITGIRNHNSEDLEYIYRTYFPMIEAYILHNSGNREQAKDVFQDAMMILYDKVRSRELKLTCKFGTYLYAICKNIWIQERKKYLLHSDKLRHQPLMVNDPGNEKDPLLEKHLTELFHKHFSELSQDCRKILTMFFNDFTIEEIREKMNYKDLHHAADRKYRCKKSLIKRIVNDPLFKRLKDEIR